LVLGRDERADLVSDSLGEDWFRAAASYGLLDVDGDRLAERRALLEFLAEQGCSVDEMAAANERGRLFGLAGDRVVRPGGDLFSLEDTARQLAMEVESVQRIWEALGFRVPAPSMPAVSLDEQGVLERLPLLLGLVGETALLDLCRSVAIGLAGVAEATSSVARSRPEMSTALSGSELETARAWARNAQFVPWMGQLLDVLFRQHLEAARQRFEASGSYATAGRQGVDLAVGFVDMSGYTAATEAMTTVQLCELVRRFERAAIDAVQAGGGRVVKFIGDAAMIVAPTADDLASAVTSLVLTWDAGEEESIAVRAGLAFGNVTSRQGDYFGSPVNLAARLVAFASRGTILVADALAMRVSAAEWDLGEEKVLDVRGFPQPIVARSLKPIQHRPSNIG
jgi:class 3 adenylate cyclase